MRITGLLLLSATPILFFFFLSEEIRKKAKKRKRFTLFLEHILFEIENFNRDQREIFEKYEDPLLEKELFLSDLREEVKKAPCGALGKTIENHLSSFGFSGQINEGILLFGKHFGMQAKNTQLKEISDLIQLLKKDNEKEKTETENKVRTTRMIGVTAGIGILILML